MSLAAISRSNLIAHAAVSPSHRVNFWASRETHTHALPHPACLHRYDGAVWYAPINELTGGHEGGNVLERARKAGKIALCLKHPDQGERACVSCMG